MIIVDPTLLVVFGLSGDLSRRKLLPSLYHLELDNLLPEAFKIVGTSRKDMNIDNLKNEITQYIENQDNGCEFSVLEKLFSRITLIQVDASDINDYAKLNQELARLENEADICMRRLFYLAIPPSILAEVINCLGQSKIDKCNHQSSGRLLVEKPFGRDVDSAQSLINLLDQYFKEDQIYRIDHYLAKETVQNILHFRFHNPIVRDIWNSKFIDHVQITVAESLGIEGRTNFYEQTGNVRDMIQSHLLQLVALTTMVEPKSLGPDDVRTAREAVLSNLKPININDISNIAIRGQYEGYRQETDNPDSLIETFSALKVEIDNDQWRDTPIYIRSGKNLERKVSEINLVYSNEPKEHTTNILTIRIQPNEGIALSLLAKKPGLDSEKQDILMDYCYEDIDSHKIRHTAYEKLLVDAMHGDQTLFPSSEEVMNNWRYVEPLLNYWHQTKEELNIYKPGSWGPELANKLLEREHIGWISQSINICLPREKLRVAK